MSSLAYVAIHPSQFPDAVQRDLAQSLRTRRVNHKFHYDSVKQTQQWLALHQAYAPSRTDEDCTATYAAGFAAAADGLKADAVHLIGLGCGGGRKDAQLLARLQRTGRRVVYTPSDVSVAMVLVAREAALVLVAPEDCHPLVCDLASAEDLPTVLDQHVRPGDARLITFFGMIPNFEPQLVLPRLAALLRPADCMLFSANLAPGPDYAAGVQRILPLYDNTLTRNWLMTFLLDLGVEPADGQLQFIVEQDPAGSELLRVAADFHFAKPRQIGLDEESFEFLAGESIRLFFSYRHTPKRMPVLLEQYGIKVLEQWVTKSEEEGVFLCRLG